MMIYKPREDSLLLQKQVKKYAKGLVLDIGTGSGIQALTTAKKRNVKKVIAVDIDKEAINYCKENIKLLNSKNSKGLEMSEKQSFSEHTPKSAILDESKTFQKDRKITFKQSDLFSNIKSKFDTIIFNPPYLPEDIKLKDLTVEGGKKGYETLERFLNKVNNYLKPNGIILIVFSSLTKKEKVDEFIENNLLKSKLVNKKHIFFEDLYVYLIEKSNLLKELEKKKIKDIKKLTKGHRGIIYIGDYKSKKVTIKKQRPDTKAITPIKNEVKWLKILNKKNIGPKLLFSNKDYFVYEYIPGLFILDFIESLEKKDKILIKKIIKDIFSQLFIMDKLMIDKEEMHHPVKHIIIDKKNKKPIMVDFERTHSTKKPKNITQFSVFLTMSYVKNLLKEKGIKVNRNKMINLCKKYKKEQNKENLNKILNSL